MWLWNGTVGDLAVDVCHHNKLYRRKIKRCLAPGPAPRPKNEPNSKGWARQGDNRKPNSKGSTTGTSVVGGKGVRGKYGDNLELSLQRMGSQ